MKIFLSVVIATVIFSSVVSAVCVDYYFNPQCSHCQQIAPFIEQIKSYFTNVKWTDHDVVEEEMSVGTPTIVVNKKITLVGSGEIPRWLLCELGEMTTPNCVTYSADEINRPTASWFVR